MARIIVAIAQENKPQTNTFPPGQDDLLRRLSKTLITHLRQNGVITLSLPYDLAVDKQIDWVNNTGYKSDSGDILLLLTKAAQKFEGVKLWFKEAPDSSDEKTTSKNLVAAIEKAVNKEEAAKVSASTEVKDYQGAGQELLKQTKLLAVSVEIGDETTATWKEEADQESFISGLVKGVTEFLGINFRPLKKNNNPADISTPARPVAPSPMPTPPAYTPAMNSLNDLGDDPFAPSSSFTPSGMGNFGAGFNPPAANFGNTPGLGSANNPFNKAPMSRDERKDMITKLYRKGFGKDPEQSDLNYFLNIGISEEQMLKRIVESQDHADMVENSKKYEEIKKKYDELEAKTSSQERNLADQKQIMDKLNSLLLQKNYALSMLQKRVQALSNRMEDLQNSNKGQTVKLNYHGSALDRLFDYFSRKLS